MRAVSTRVVDSTRVYAGRTISLRVDTLLLSSGRTITREVVEHPGAVAIVAVDQNGSILLIRQYRSGP